MTLYDSVGVDLEGFPALVVKTYNGGQGLRQSDHDLPLCYTKGPNVAERNLKVDVLDCHQNIQYNMICIMCVYIFF